MDLPGVEDLVSDVLRQVVEALDEERSHYDTDAEDALFDRIKRAVLRVADRLDGHASRCSDSDST